MVEHGKELLLCGRNRLSRSRLSPLQQVRLDAIQARSYSDDEDVQRGALSLPRSSARPGTRDDGLRCPFAGVVAVL